MSERAGPSGWHDGWIVDPASVAAFAGLDPGQQIVVAKWGPDGDEVTRYPSTVVETTAPAPWLEVEARWTIPEVNVAGLVFAPGDTLREFFSPCQPYNAFAVYGPDGSLRGWYGNVTFPALVIRESGTLVLVWRDLYLDAVILPDGETFLLDDDELEEAGIPLTDQAFAQAIVSARHDLLTAIPTFPVKG